MQTTVIRGILNAMAAGLIFTAGFAVSPSLAAPGDASPPVYGKSIGNWGLAWWQWATNFPKQRNPIEQLSGPVDCAAGQSGSVWFLAGTFGKTAVRTCSIEEGKALLFPIINSLFWSGDDCPNRKVNECRAKAAELINPLFNWTCEVDGLPCIYRNQVVRDQSDALPYNIPAYSWVAKDFAPGLRKFGISDGYWVMLEPLSPGRHTIHFTSAACPITADKGCTGDKFALDVTYKLIITRRR